MNLNRDYESIGRSLSAASDRATAMQAVVDRLWDGLSAAGVSWVGFYLRDGDEALVLGPRRDKPACSPIGLHGACGRALLTRAALIVGDVRRLGAHYVACDPRDQSELVIPLLEVDGTCWGVLDLDSFDCDAFCRSDVAGLFRILRQAGLTHCRTIDELPIEIV